MRPAPDTPAIVTRALACDGSVVGAALRGVTVRVELGELVAVVDPRDAGASSLLRAVTGALRPTAGAVRVLGIDPWSAARRCRRHGATSVVVHHAPTAGSDDDLTVERLRAHTARGRAVIVATRDPRLAGACDRAVVLSGGRVVGEVRGGSVAAIERVIADADAVRRRPRPTQRRVGPDRLLLPADGGSSASAARSSRRPMARSAPAGRVRCMHTNHTPTSSFATTAALVAGPVITALGMGLTPWEQESTTASYQAALAAHPTQGQWAAIALTIGYALMGAAYLAILQRARSAPRPLYVAAVIAAFLGATILPGMVSVDFYDLALAQRLPQAEAIAVADQVQSAPIAIILHVLAGIGYVLGGVLALTTAWRAKLVGGWAPLLAVASFIAPTALMPGGLGITVGAAMVATSFAGIAVRLRRVRRGAEPMVVAVDLTDRSPMPREAAAR
ncbi:MAG: hypothetical protein AAGC46_13245 [Solirubrobacteraceae bacterium]|nr:hypothetical protein [Patulibacter sp.]